MYPANNPLPLQLNKLTVAVLKDFLKSVGRKPAGKKQDLIQEVEDYFMNLN